MTDEKIVGTNGACPKLLGDEVTLDLVDHQFGHNPLTHEVQKTNHYVELVPETMDVKLQQTARLNGAQCGDGHQISPTSRSNMVSLMITKKLVHI